MYSSSNWNYVRLPLLKWTRRSCGGQVSAAWGLACWSHLPVYTSSVTGTRTHNVRTAALQTACWWRVTVSLTRRSSPRLIRALPYTALTVRERWAKGDLHRIVHPVVTSYQRPPMKKHPQSLSLLTGTIVERSASAEIARVGGSRSFKVSWFWF